MSTFGTRHYTVVGRVMAAQRLAVYGHPGIDQSTKEICYTMLDDTINVFSKVFTADNPLFDPEQFKQVSKFKDAMKEDES